VFVDEIDAVGVIVVLVLVGAMTSANKLSTNCWLKWTDLELTPT
jgi:hypothetical protein